MALIKTAVTLRQDQLDRLDKISEEPGELHERSRAWLIRRAIDIVYGSGDTAGKEEDKEE